jgi:hypothetical protein
MADNQEQAGQKQWAQVVARAWADAAYKKRLLAEPGAVLKEAGLELPAGVDVRVLEDTDCLVTFLLPPPPSGEELSEEELVTVAGGGCNGYSTYKACSQYHCNGKW